MVREEEVHLKFHCKFPLQFNPWSITGEGQFEPSLSQLNLLSNGPPWTRKTSAFGFFSSFHQLNNGTALEMNFA